MTGEDNLEKLAEMAEQEAQNERLRNQISAGVVENLPDALIVADEKDRIFLVNKEAELMFGYMRKDLFGAAVEILVPVQSRETHRTHRARYRREPRTRYMGAGMKLAAQHKDGTTFSVEISLAPLPTERGLFVMTTIRRTREDA